jgi:uncharacterized protein YhfF
MAVVRAMLQHSEAPLGRNIRMDRPKTSATDAFWQAYRAHAGIATAHYDVVSFDDTPETATEFAALVLAGRKRATAGLAANFLPNGEPPPVLGGHVVLVDGAGLPVAVWRTTDLRTGPLESVDDRFAWDEGEGDRSRAYWLAVHQKFFGREAKRLGIEMHDGIETVFERFTVVWPPEVADKA